MRCLVAVVQARPLVLHFSLYNPPESASPAWAPLSLEPFGAFIAVEIRDAAGTVIYASHRPKWTPKLRPDCSESYVRLDPGYSHGVLLEVPVGAVSPGALTLEVSYSNLGYQGFPGHQVGQQTCQASVYFRAEGT
jgi:hypothetical protein